MVAEEAVVVVEMFDLATGSVMVVVVTTLPVETPVSNVRLLRAALVVVVVDMVEEEIDHLQGVDLDHLLVAAMVEPGEGVVEEMLDRVIGSVLVVPTTLLNGQNVSNVKLLRVEVEVVAVMEAAEVVMAAVVVVAVDMEEGTDTEVVAADTVVVVAMEAAVMKVAVTEVAAAVMVVAATEVAVMVEEMKVDRSDVLPQRSVTVIGSVRVAGSTTLLAGLNVSNVVNPNRHLLYLPSTYQTQFKATDHLRPPCSYILKRRSF